MKKTKKKPTTHKYRHGGIADVLGPTHTPRAARQRGIKREAGIWEQLMGLKALTLELGVIHSAQADQLKLWGPLAFPHAQDIEIGVGLPFLEDGQIVDQNKVEYRVLAGTRPPADLKKRLDGLDRSVVALLGEHFELRCLVNGEAIFCRKGKARKKTDLAKTMARLQNVDGTDER